MERHDFETLLAREAYEQRAGPASDQHSMPAPGQVAAQTEDGLRRAGAFARVRELENRERRRRHAPKVVILGRPCTSWSRRTTGCRSKVTAARSASWSRWSAGSRRWATV